MVLKTSHFHSLWLKSDSADDLDQLLSLAYPNLNKSQVDAEADAKVFYPFDFLLTEGILVGLFAVSSGLWEHILFSALAIAAAVFHLVFFFFFSGRYLFRIRGTQIIGEAEDPNFMDNFTERTMTACNVRSIGINRSKKSVFFGSLYKSFHISLAKNPEAVADWFEGAFSESKEVSK